LASLSQAESKRINVQRRHTLALMTDLTTQRCMPPSSRMPRHPFDWRSIQIQIWLCMYVSSGTSRGFFVYYVMCAEVACAHIMHREYNGICAIWTFSGALQPYILSLCKSIYR
jgi:hypothetical protein